MPGASAVRPLPGKSAQAATRIAFLVAGIGMSAWAPLVPYAKARAGLDDGRLGLLLLCLGVGSIVAMPLAGLLAGRFGCRRVLLAATALVCLSLVPLATLDSLQSLMLALFVFGAGIGSLDCTANLQAVIVERAAGRALMSGFHGLFSVGGMLGALVVTGLLGLGLSPALATVAVIATLVAALGFAAPHLLPYGSDRDGPAFAWPRGTVLLIGALCFIVFLAEGAMLDWSAVFLNTRHAVDASRAGVGYAAFSLAMTICRLAGDAVVHRFGGARVLLLGGLGAAAGLVLATLAPAWPVALAGFTLVGMGCANVVPVLYSALGRQTAMPESLAVPAVTTLGYAGILAGPAAIGAVAQLFSLETAFLLVAAALLAVAASSRSGMLAKG